MAPEAVSGGRRAYVATSLSTPVQGPAGGYCEIPADEVLEVVRLVFAWMLVNGLLLAPEWIAAALTP